MTPSPLELTLIILCGFIVLPLYVHCPIYTYRFLKMRKIARIKGGQYQPSVLLLILNLLIVLAPPVGYAILLPVVLLTLITAAPLPTVIVSSLLSLFLFISIPLTYYLAIRQNRLYRAAMAEAETAE